MQIKSAPCLLTGAIAAVPFGHQPRVAAGRLISGVYARCAGESACGISTHWGCAIRYRGAVPHTQFVSLRRLEKGGGGHLIVYRERFSLVRDLGIPSGTLYAVSDTLDRHYLRRRIPKSSGGVRELSVPDPLLKHIQRRILQVLLVHLPASPYATAYRYGGSTLRNAAPHVGKPCVLKLDIRHFFGSILCSSVKGIAFPVEIYAEDLQILLAMLCYDRDRAGGQPGLERARRGPSEAAAGAAFLPEIRHFRLHGPGGHPGTGGPLSGLFAGPARRGARKSRPHRHINIPPERFYRDVPAVFIFRRGSDAEFSPARAGATAAGARRPAAGPAP